MKKDVTILVNSCDKYEDAWEPFFKLLSIQWKDCPYRIILNTEQKTYSCDYLNVETIQTGNEKTWTERVKAALKIIDSEFILFCLEDFFLLSSVDVESWDNVIKNINDIDDIGFVWFPPNRIPLDELSKKTISQNLSITKTNVSFRVNATLGLWRKEFFMQMLYRDGDPWHFEWSATKLSRYSDFKTTFWNQEKNCIFNYEIRPESGLGIVRGKWLPGNKDLFSKYNLNINFENLGFTTVEEAIISCGTEKKINNKFLKRINTLKKKIRRKINDIKRFFKLYPAFKKYCKKIKTQNIK